MTKIILVRHGHVEGISPERFRGRADLMLTDEGLRQAEATAHRIYANWTPIAVYASPLGRCQATAAAIARPFGLSPATLDEFRFAVEQMDPREYLEASYYERWLYAIEMLLREKGVIDAV